MLVQEPEDLWVTPSTWTGGLALYGEPEYKKWKSHSTHKPRISVFSFQTPQEPAKGSGPGVQEGFLHTNQQAQKYRQEHVMWRSPSQEAYHVHLLMLNLLLKQENAKESDTEILKARHLVMKSVPDLPDGGLCV